MTDPRAELAHLIASEPPAPERDDYWDAYDRRQADALDALGEPDYEDGWLSDGRRAVWVGRRRSA